VGFGTSPRQTIPVGTANIDIFIILAKNIYAMKRIITSIFISLIFSVMTFAQAGWINFERYDQANKQVQKAPKAVFMGDSITDSWLSSDPDFFNSNNFLGRGISGQVTSQMVLRFQRDVIANHPKYVVILGGINDIAQNEGPIDIEDSFNNIVSMVQLAKANKIKPVICLLFPTMTFPWRPSVEDVLVKVQSLNKMLADYGKANRIPVMEYLKETDKSAGTLPKELSADSIHPNMDGYKIMEQEILKVLK